MRKTKILWITWVAAYVICTVCGFIPASQDSVYGLLILLSLGFFVPPGLLLFDAVQNRNRRNLKIIRTLSLSVLCLSLAMIILNFVSVHASEAWGTVLYWLLIIVSTPMVCSQVWVIGLFGWAMLLMTCMTYLKRKQ